MTKSFLIKKNLLDMDYQRLVSEFNIVAIVEATAILTVWFSTLEAIAKIALSVPILVSGSVFLYMLRNKMFYLRAAVGRLE